MSLTVVYYSACVQSQRFGDAVRAELLKSINGRYQIVSVTHKPLAFGDVRIVVGEVTPSIYQIYRNLLAGALAAKTKFIACAEDDSLYVHDFWDYRPQLDVFAYDQHRLVLTRRLSEDKRRREAVLYFRERHQLAQLVCSRELLIETLEERFRAYPEPMPHEIAKIMGFGEPGRYEKNLRLTRRKMEYFWTKQPNITINAGGVMGRRAMNQHDVLSTEAEPWGNANDLWRRIVGE